MHLASLLIDAPPHSPVSPTAQTLHYQVQHLNLPNSDYYQKLLLLKSEKGGLSAEDEKRFKVRRMCELVLGGGCGINLWRCVCV